MPELDDEPYLAMTTLPPPTTAAEREFEAALRREARLREENHRLREEVSLWKTRLGNVNVAALTGTSIVEVARTDKTWSEAYANVVVLHQRYTALEELQGKLPWPVIIAWEIIDAVKREVFGAPKTR